MSFKAWLLHLRPRSWPIVFAHFSCGALVTLKDIGEHWGTSLAQVLLGGVVWAVFLNGGTLALNTAFDCDEGDIGYLDHPPPPPRGLAPAAMALMLSGCLIAWWALPPLYTGALIICVVLSFLYSVPPIRLKSVAGADLVVNVVGYGALTFAAGALAAGAGANAYATVWLRVGVLAASFGCLFGAFYPMTQIYQMPEDHARGDRTFALMLGEKGSLLFSLMCIVCAFGLQWLALHFRSRGPSGGDWLPPASVALNFVLWAGFTADWLRRRGIYPAKRGMYRALWLWAITDVTTALAFGLST